MGKERSEVLNPEVVEWVYKIGIIKMIHVGPVVGIRPYSKRGWTYFQCHSGIRKPLDSKQLFVS
jgi:hypothetical protein